MSETQPPVVQLEPAPESPAQPVSAQGLVFRNTMLLMIAQVVTTPLSIAVNAVMGRYLGPADFGFLYLAGTYINFGFLAVDWGQAGMLPLMVSRARDRAGEILGSALAWRLVVAPVVYVVLASICSLLGYSRTLQILLALAFIGSVVGTVSSACQDAIRAFERTDIAAITQVLASLLSVLVVVPVLILGGGIRGVLVAQAACSSLVLIVLLRTLRGMGIRRPTFSRDVVKQLLVGGVPFLVFGIGMVMQPTIDAAYLSTLGSAESVGWYAAARKLIGVLATPASALIAALYPTLARLFPTDENGFRRTSRDALRTSSLLAAPLALGCFLFPDVGVRIFSKMTFGPAQDDLRILAPFIFLLYFSMPLGACLAAAGRTKRWAGTQLLCVAVSAVLDPILVPRFQARFGNGGMGVCVATTVSELLMVGAALTVAPPGILDRLLLKTLLIAAIGGAAMAGAARLLSGITPYVAAPLAVAAYFGCVWVMGGIEPEQVAMFRSAIARKARRT